MDILRSCYSSRWNFPGVGEVRGYYYFCDPETPFYPGWSWFGSRNWHNGDGTPWPLYGELEGVKQRWRDGSFPTTRPDLLTVGTEAQIAGEMRCPDDPPAQLVAGVDLRCWKHPYHWLQPSDGGLVIGETAEHSAGFAFAGDGGLVLGDVAEHFAALHFAGDGGLVLGDQAEHFAALHFDSAGGLVLGDQAEHFAALHFAGDGGLILGDQAEHFQGFAFDGAGGLVLGDQASYFQGFTFGCLGGVKIGGNPFHKKNAGGFVPDTIFVHDDGIKACIDSITGKTPTPIGAGVIRLFVNNLADDKTKVIGNFTEATFPGYAPITPGSAAWGAGGVAANVATASTPGGLVFTLSSAVGGPFNVYGWFWTDGPNAKLWFSARFTGAPVVLTNAGDNLTIQDPLNCRSLN